ncbi:MAG TPA: hypothetical protein DEG43_04065 [Acidimicrobiaceae bacterium]|nr:hypothetical protein [Acidimicrobiaceae bacterium]
MVDHQPNLQQTPASDILFSEVSFKISSGDHAALIGINGIGKSTLLRIPKQTSGQFGRRVVPGRVGRRGQSRR